MSSSITADLHQDTRLIERRLAKGFMSRAEADKLNDKLPDLADKAEWVTVDDDDSDSDED
ncbi:MAG TPA: hypothetical protein PK095_24515 [Myxococcota bacterium]|nr:hypothetical protein [Myxococcota bacterium]